MKELIKRFKKFREENTSLGDVIIMSMTVDGKQYPKELIQRAFNALVSKEEYDKSEKKEIIQSLVSYSKKNEI